MLCVCACVRVCVCARVHACVCVCVHMRVCTYYCLSVLCSAVSIWLTSEVILAGSE